MSALAAIQPAQSGYVPEASAASDHADIRIALYRLAPTFNFDRALANPTTRIIVMRKQAALCGFVILVHGVMKFYYADDALTARALMAQIETPTASRQ